MHWQVLGDMIGGCSEALHAGQTIKIFLFLLVRLRGESAVHCSVACSVQTFELLQESFTLAAFYKIYLILAIHIYTSLKYFLIKGKSTKDFNGKFDILIVKNVFFKICLINIQYPNIKNFHLVEEGSEKRSLTAHTEETETSNKIGESRTRSLPSSSPSNNQRDTVLYSFTQTVPANI